MLVVTGLAPCKQNSIADVPQRPVSVTEGVHCYHATHKYCVSVGSPSLLDARMSLILPMFVVWKATR